MAKSRSRLFAELAGGVASNGRLGRGNLDADAATYDAATANFTGDLQKSGVSVAADSNLNSFVTAFTLPTSDGSADQMLKTDGAGTLSFATPAAGYADADVDTHLNTSTATTNDYLQWDGSDYNWATVPAGYADADVDTHLNTSTASANEYLQWDGSDYTWAAVSSGSSLDAVNVMGSRTVSSNTTVSATESAFSVGPITIADGITVTVASGGRWVVI